MRLPLRLPLLALAVEDIRVAFVGVLVNVGICVGLNVGIGICVGLFVESFVVIRTTVVDVVAFVEVVKVSFEFTEKFEIEAGEY